MTKEPHILVIDDEAKLLASLIYGLGLLGVKAEGASTAREGLAYLEKKQPDMAFVDLRLPDANGIELLSTIKARCPALPVVMISAHGDIRVAVEAVKVGALDFIAKPFELEDIVALIREIVGKGKKTRPSIPKGEQKPGHYPFDLVGDSAVMNELREKAEIIAQSSARIILLLGPSGSGKGQVAHMLHRSSPRANGPFVVVNCASLPEHLLEAELFGAERGAYTGAHQKRAGLVELAEKGTLFLDEMGELPQALQAKLLRFLESRAYRPVGGSIERMADIRVIAATNRDLEAEVRDGRFRTDLFYRLNIVPIHIPALEARRDDILPLADWFARKQAEMEGTAPIAFSPAAQRCLIAYKWPGNVRELRNLVERLTILHPGQTIEVEQLPFGDAQEAPSPPLFGIEEQMVSTERDILLKALEQAGGSKGKAADLLGISRYALKRRLTRLNLD